MYRFLFYVEWVFFEPNAFGFGRWVFFFDFAIGFFTDLRFGVAVVGDDFHAFAHEECARACFGGIELCKDRENAEDDDCCYERIAPLVEGEFHLVMAPISPPASMSTNATSHRLLMMYRMVWIIVRTFDQSF